MEKHKGYAFSPPPQENNYPQQNLHEWVIKRETNQTSSPLNWTPFRSFLSLAPGSKISSLTALNQSDFADYVIVKYADDILGSSLTEAYRAEVEKLVPLVLRK